MEKPKELESAGVALIKSEYLMQDYTRELDLNFVAKNDKKQIENKDKRDSEGPPRKKLKGQNKNRPRNKKAPKSSKLCFKFVDGSCPFGDGCSYSHDVQTYLASKPPDLGSICVMYRTYGKCPYSYSCRYGSDHIKDGINLICEEKWSEFKDKKLHLNTITKALQISLRKYEYDFTKSTNAMKKTDKFLKSLKNTNSSDCDKGTVSNSNVASIEQTDTTNDNKGEDAAVKIETKNSSEHKQDTGNSLPNEASGLNIPPKKDVIDDILFEREIKQVDFKDKLYLAPLTTVGNLPFRRLCKELGADITCSEMAMSVSLLQGQQSEWALIKRHPTEDIFGIQLCGSHPDHLTRCCQVLADNMSFDFIDLNLGCPLEWVYKKGGGCGLMNRTQKLREIIYDVSSVVHAPLTIKMRTGLYSTEKIAHSLIEKIKSWKAPVSLITLHGRSREQRYTKSADWSYIQMCREVADPIPLFGNGDVLSYEDYNMHKADSGVPGIMIARGALIKPWIFTEIKEQRHWDISSSERFDMLKKFSNYGLEHWGSDTEGIEKTRRFMLEWLSFLYRYIPVGLLEKPPQKINERPPPYLGRNDLETLMASPSCSDWVKISEMILGPVPESFVFLPKHKANAYK